MYKRVEAQIILSGISKKELAKNIGISYNTLNSKLNGKSAFSLNEAAQIKRLLKAEEPIETLFDKSA
jgi:DNA-binding XRE family transcriptional regulator